MRKAGKERTRDRRSMGIWKGKSRDGNRAMRRSRWGNEREEVKG